MNETSGVEYIGLGGFAEAFLLLNDRSPPGNDGAEADRQTGMALRFGG